MGFPVDFNLRLMDATVQDLTARLGLELPDTHPTEQLAARVIESALLRIPLPAAVASFDPETHHYVVRYGGAHLVALREFMREGSSFRLIGGEFALPDRCAGATFAELPGRWRTRIQETPLRLYEVQPATPQDVVVSLGRRMNGEMEGESA